MEVVGVESVVVDEGGGEDVETVVDDVVCDGSVVSPAEVGAVSSDEVSVDDEDDNVVVAVDPDAVDEVDEPPDVAGPVSDDEVDSLAPVVVVAPEPPDADTRPLTVCRREPALEEAVVEVRELPGLVPLSELDGSPSPSATTPEPSSSGGDSPSAAPNRLLRSPDEPESKRATDPSDSASPAEPADTTPTGGSAVEPSESLPMDRTRPTTARPTTSTATTFSTSRTPTAKRLRSAEPARPGGDRVGRLVAGWTTGSMDGNDSSSGLGVLWDGPPNGIGPGAVRPSSCRSNSLVSTASRGENGDRS